MAYDTGSWGKDYVDVPNWRVVRPITIAGFTVISPVISGGVTHNPPSGGPGGAPPALAVGYQWPRGDGTPSAS